MRLIPENAILGHDTLRMFPGMDTQSLTAAFSDRGFKNMSLHYGDTDGSLKNRINFFNGLEIDYRRVVCAKQVHQSAVRVARRADCGSGALTYESSIPGTDAFITNELNVPLIIFSADCLPVFLYDPLTPAVGMVHAGWRSSKENITAQAIQAMQMEFGTKPQDLYVGFGPAIRNCCYEVSEEFSDFFPQEVSRINDKLHLDLVLVNKSQAVLAGVSRERMFDTQMCTFCRNDDFFSFRKEGPGCGRMLSVIMLKENHA